MRIWSALLLASALCGAEWRSLFDGKTFAGWDDPASRSPEGDGWKIDDGCLMSNPKPRLREDLVTRDSFGDFELTFDWKIAPGTNSGVKYLMQDRKFIDIGRAQPGTIQQQVAAEYAGPVSDRSSTTGKGKDYSVGFEFQLIDDAKHAESRAMGLYSTGSMYSLLAATASAARPAGEWNNARIVVRDGVVGHWINGVQVLSAKLADPRIAAGLEKRWGREHPVYRLLTERPKQRAPIVLTHHGDQAWFRNIRIREFEDENFGLKRRTDVQKPSRRDLPEGQLLIVPAGTKIPLALRQPISTRGAKAGDPIYAQTTFPVVQDGFIVIPAGTWVQGVVDNVKRAGRLKGTAELEFHLTRLIYGNGYTLVIKAAIDQVPGDTGANMKEPGTVTQNSQKGKDLERVGVAASQAGQIGSLAGVAARPGLRGFGVGGVSGIAAGTLVALLARGSDVTFPTGTAVEIALTQAMAIERKGVTAPPAQ